MSNQVVIDYLEGLAVCADLLIDLKAYDNTATAAGMTYVTGYLSAAKAYAENMKVGQ